MHFIRHKVAFEISTTCAPHLYVHPSNDQYLTVPLLHIIHPAKLVCKWCWLPLRLQSAASCVRPEAKSGCADACALPRQGQQQQLAGQACHQVAASCDWLRVQRCDHCCQRSCDSTQQLQFLAHCRRHAQIASVTNTELRHTSMTCASTQSYHPSGQHIFC